MSIFPVTNSRFQGPTFPSSLKLSNAVLLTISTSFLPVRYRSRLVQLHPNNISNASSAQLNASHNTSRVSNSFKSPVAVSLSFPGLTYTIELSLSGAVRPEPNSSVPAIHHLKWNSRYMSSSFQSTQAGGGA